MTRDELIRECIKYKHSNISIQELLTAVDAYLSASNGVKPIVSGSLPLDETKATELAQIGSKYVYEDALGYGRISEAGIFEVIKKYEEFKRQ